MKKMFFDHKGNLVLETDIENAEIITYNHIYISSKKNLLTYSEICIFHKNDGDIAKELKI